MNEEKYKKMWDNMLKKLNEEEKFYLAIVNNQKNEEIERLNNIINKAIRHIEILLEIALEQDSDNVNLIDRLKGILDILKGSDKE